MKRGIFLFCVFLFIIITSFSVFAFGEIGGLGGLGTLPWYTSYRVLDNNYEGECGFVQDQETDDGLIVPGRWQCSSSEPYGCYNDLFKTAYVCSASTYCGISQYYIRSRDIFVDKISCLPKGNIGDYCSANNQCLSRRCDVQTNKCDCSIVVYAGVTGEDCNSNGVPDNLCPDTPCLGGFNCDRNSGSCVLSQQQDAIYRALDDVFTAEGYTFTSGGYNAIKNIAGSCGSGSNLSCVNYLYSNNLLSACVEVDQTNSVRNVQVCALNNYCSSSGQSYSCVARKSENENCQNSYECSTNQCQNGKCVPGVFTFPIAPCGTDFDCAAGQICDERFCKDEEGQICSLSSECLSNNCLSGICEKSCSQDSNCSIGDTCSGGVCKSSEGDYCISNNQCQSNNCANNRCASSVLLGCTTDADCPSGTCRNNECVSGAVPSITSCSSNSDCSVNQTCDSGACKKTTAQGCSISSECLSNNCVSGNCSRSCNRDSDCSNNYDCSSGMCKAPDNSACITNNQCQGGNCTNSKCISQACTRDSDCASNYECTNNKCVEIEEETTGLSCNDVSGIVCSTGKCINGALSTNTREINCCVSSGQGTLGCEGAPQYISALSSAIRFDKSCLSNGMSEVKVVDVSNENRQFTQDELSALGLTSQTYTEQDYSCGGITVSPKEAQTVNGYSLMALLVSFAILFAYYFWNKK